MAQNIAARFRLDNYITIYWPVMKRMKIHLSEKKFASENDQWELDCCVLWELLVKLWLFSWTPMQIFGNFIYWKLYILF